MSNLNTQSDQVMHTYSQMAKLSHGWVKKELDKIETNCIICVNQGKWHRNDGNLFLKSLRTTTVEKWEMCAQVVLETMGMNFCHFGIFFYCLLHNVA